jgi:hypothetical protein
MCNSTFSLTLALDGGGWSTPRPGCFTRYPLYRRLGRPQGRSGLVLKISPPRGFFFCLSGVFSPLIHFLLFKSCRPSCHFTVHTTVLTTNTTHTSRPPVGFFLSVRVFSPLINFLLFKSFRPSCHFTFHTTVLTTNTTQTSMPPVGFEPTIPVSERLQTHALDRASTGIGMDSIPGPSSP